MPHLKGSRNRFHSRAALAAHHQASSTLVVDLVDRLARISEPPGHSLAGEQDFLMARRQNARRVAVIN